MQQGAMSGVTATLLREYINEQHGGKLAPAGRTLGKTRQTMAEQIDKAYVIDGRLYTCNGIKNPKS